MSRTSIINTPWDHGITIHAMPTGGKPVKMDKAVQVDGAVVFRGADGKLYCPRVKPGLSYPCSSVFGFTRGLMNGLVALGEITRAQANAFTVAATKRDAQSSARHHLDYLDNLIKTYGLKVAARERAKLVTAAGGAA